MHSWTEDFGSFWTDSHDWEPKKTIHIRIQNDTTGEKMVTMAIRLAKKYNCKIIGRVEYTPHEPMGGTVAFMVECHANTYRYFYDGGRLPKTHSSEIKEKDIAAYEQQFGTRKCVDNHIGKNRFFFTDNWNGSVLYFPTLKKAKDAAKKQFGGSCCIFEIQPYGRGSKIVSFAPASGFTPP